MFRRFLFVLLILALLLPVAVFITYIVVAEGDQWTSEHFLATGIFAIPFFIVLLLNYIVYGGDKT